MTYSRLKTDADERIVAAELRAASLDAAFLHSPDILALAGSDGCLRRVNPSWRRVLGWGEQDRPGALAEWLHPDDRSTQLAATTRLLRGEPVVSFEGRLRRRDGVYCWISWSVVLLPEGSTLFFTGRDVTDRKRVEEQSVAFHLLGELLNRATTPEEAARVVLGIADGLFGWDACRLELFNEDGLTSRRVLLMDTIEGERRHAAPPGEDLRISREASLAVEQGPQLIERGPDYQLTPESRPFGDTGRPSLSIAIVPIRSGARAIGALSMQSYTAGAYRPEDLVTLAALADYCAAALERTQAEEFRRQCDAQLLHAQKMEAVGQLAGGVAHDFNNMLAVILGYTELLLTDSPTPAARGFLEQVKSAAERSATLTKQLLAYSRRQMLLPRELDLNQVLLEVKELLGCLLGDETELELKPAPQLGLVKADRAQIQQVLVNLVANARDAMPRGGRVTIRTQSAVLEPQVTRRYPDVIPGGYALIEVADTGCGMPPDVLAHLFEPFFTTKPVGKGTGLGLASVHGIIKQSGGHIEVESRPGEGTAFRVYLPVIGTADSHFQLPNSYFE